MTAPTRQLLAGLATIALLSVALIAWAEGVF